MDLVERNVSPPDGCGIKNQCCGIGRAGEILKVPPALGPGFYPCRKEGCASHITNFLELNSGTGLSKRWGPPPSVIIMEVYNFQISQSALRFHEMCAHMESLGFRCYDMADPMLRDHDKALWQMDLFFCRKDEKIFDHPHYK